MSALGIRFEFLRDTSLVQTVPGFVVYIKAPPLHGVETLTEAVVTLTPTKFTFELEGEPDNAADLKLIIMASAPQSNGVTRAYGKAVQIAQPLEAVCEEYDIKEDFGNKHGTPNEPRHFDSSEWRVFLKL